MGVTLGYPIADRTRYGVMVHPIHCSQQTESVLEIKTKCLT